MQIRVAGYQMPVVNDIDANVSQICAAIEQAATEKAEILLTPEGSLSGYRHEFDNAAVRKGLRVITKLARERGVGLALGTCFVEDNGQCYNQIRFIRQDGVYLGFHAKTLRCGTLTHPPVGEINHYGVTDLRTFEWREGLPIGGLICNDLWANPGCTPMPDPHLSQQLSELGARIIFHAVNGGRDGSDWSEVAWRYHDANLRMRAQAGNVWIVTVDSSEPAHLPCSAPSGVISPQGQWVCQVDNRGEQFFVFSIDLDGIHA